MRQGWQLRGGGHEVLFERKGSKGTLTSYWLIAKASRSEAGSHSLTCPLHLFHYGKWYIVYHVLGHNPSLMAIR